jgi:hypothetical protein
MNRAGSRISESLSFRNRLDPNLWRTEAEEKDGENEEKVEEKYKCETYDC